jgi:hypothetical protein
VAPAAAAAIEHAQEQPLLRIVSSAPTVVTSLQCLSWSDVVAKPARCSVLRRPGRRNDVLQDEGKAHERKPPQLERAPRHRPRAVGIASTADQFSLNCFPAESPVRADACVAQYSNLTSGLAAAHTWDEYPADD